MSRQLTELTDKPVGRLLWSYSLPAVVGMLVMSLYNVFDRVIIGQVVGADAISGLTVTFPVMNLSAAVGVLIGVGASSRISILLGQGRREAAENVLGNALMWTLINASIYLTLLALFLDPVLIAFGASEVTLPYAHDFMTVILPGMLVMNITFSFNNIMRASGYPTRAMVTMLIGACLNILLVSLFVLGLGFGIKGAALATDLAMVASAVFVMGHFTRKSSTLRFRRGIYGIRWKILVDIAAIGAAPSVVNAAACLINIILNRSLYEYGGDAAIGAAGVFVTYTSLLTSVIIGMAQGLQPVLGYNYGAERYDRLRRAFILAATGAVTICSAGTIVGQFCPEAIARAFTVDANLINRVSEALPMAMKAFWFVGFQIIATCLFQSTGMAGRSIFLSLTRQVLFLIPLLLFLPHRWGLAGVWNSFAISDVVATVLAAWMVCRFFRALRQDAGPARFTTEYQSQKV